MPFVMVKGRWQRLSDSGSTTASSRGGSSDAGSDVHVAPHFAQLAGVLDPLALEVLTYFFGAEYDGKAVANEQHGIWFGKDENTDREMAARFKHHLDKVAAGECDSWMDHPYGVLALVILMDQFPRAIFRNTARAFAYDWKAAITARSALARKMDQQLGPWEKCWLYLVLAHNEDLQEQRDAWRLGEIELTAMPPGFFNMWMTIYERHVVVIEWFGRFPHRNEALQRVSTEEEKAFIRDPKYRFDLPIKFTYDPVTGAPSVEFVLTGDNPAGGANTRAFPATAEKGRSECVGFSCDRAIHEATGRRLAISEATPR